MKIGILTLPLHVNYGGILQAYALQTILERMGHDVVVITKSPYLSLPIWKRPFSYFKRAIKKYIQGKETLIFVEQCHNRDYPIVSQYIQPFINKYIHYVEVNNLFTLQENDFDAIIVGSDQIWRPIYFQPIEHAFLSFARSWHIKRIAYAASFGVDKWEYTNKQTLHCAELIKLFDAVSLREVSGVELCRKYLGVKSCHVLDPTMLLDVKDYIQLIEKSNISKSEGTLLNYILDDNMEKDNIVKKISKEKNLVPFKINSKVEDKNAPLDERIQPPLEQWIRGFYDAKLVVTDSFHACVFSILFNKPFIVIANEVRGLARIQSLLKMFELEDRLIFSLRDYQGISEMLPRSLGQKLTIYRELSVRYLSENCKYEFS